MSLEPFVFMNNGNIVLNAVDLNDLYLKISDYEIDYIGEVPSPKRVFVKTRLSDNLLNHVLISCGISYTSGFPADLLKGVSEKDKKRVGKSGIRGVWWFICAALLGSDAESFSETMQFLAQAKDWIIERKIGNLIEPFVEGFEVYSRYLSMVTERVSVRPEDFDELSTVVENCYHKYYSDYWEGIQATLNRRCESLERIQNGIKSLDYLEYLAARKFPAGHLEMFLVDVFREGGGIYAAYPNRIVMCSGRNIALMAHTGLAHEGGHLICHGWEKESEASEALEAINQKAGKDLRMTVEEHAMALIQLRMDEHYIRKRRTTHGYMGNRFFRTLENHWDEYVSKSDRNISDLVTKAILDASKDVRTLEELKKLAE